MTRRQEKDRSLTKQGRLINESLQHQEKALENAETPGDRGRIRETGQKERDRYRETGRKERAEIDEKYRKKD